ncbi:MAG: hypothetical protein F9K42_08150, partial [Ignavibacterium sp.]
MVETLLHKDIPLDEGNYLLLEYLDNYQVNGKKVKVKDIGRKIALTSAFFFDYLKEYHIPTTFLRKDGENSLKFSVSNELSFRVKILNNADKRNSKIFGMKEGAELNLPVFEFHYGCGKESI